MNEIDSVYLLSVLLISLVVTSAACLIVTAGIRTKLLMRLLLCYSLVLSVAATLSIYSSLSTLVNGVPNLLGDGIGYYKQASLLQEYGVLNYNELIRSNYLGYQIFLALLFIVFGKSLLVGILANCVVLILMASILYRLTLSIGGNSRAAYGSVLLFVLTPQPIYYAILLLKDPMIMLSFVLVMYALVRLAKGRQLGGWELLILTLALAVLGAMRATFLIFALGIIASFIAVFLRKRSYIIVVIFAGLVVLAPLLLSLTKYSLDAQFIGSTLTDNVVVSNKLESGNVDTEGVMGIISGRYLALPFAVQVPLFIIPVGLQFFLPFKFWGTAFLSEHFAYLFSRNLNVLWFLYVGIWFLFSIFNLKRLANPLLSFFLIVGLSMYCLIAIMFGGAIPRYASPAIVFVYPAMGYWWALSREDHEVRRRLRSFFARYYWVFLILSCAYLLMILV